jgi:hypothetical protein
LPSSFLRYMETQLGIRTRGGTLSITRDLRKMFEKKGGELSSPPVKLQQLA